MLTFILNGMVLAISFLWAHSPTHAHLSGLLCRCPCVDAAWSLGRCGPSKLPHAGRHSYLLCLSFVLHVAYHCDGSLEQLSSIAGLVGYVLPHRNWWRCCTCPGPHLDFVLATMTPCLASLVFPRLLFALASTGPFMAPIRVIFSSWRQPGGGRCLGHAFWVRGAERGQASIH